MRERKRLIRLLVTDVTLIKTGEQITAHVRLSGGQQHTLQRATAAARVGSAHHPRQRRSR